MKNAPGRLAVAINPDEPVPAPATLALLSALNRSGHTVRYFRSQACLDDSASIALATGVPPRHLDAWLMPPELLATLFDRGLRDADLGIVEGCLRSDTGPMDFGQPGRPGPLGGIREALDLPTLAVVDSRSLDRRHAIPLDGHADAILLDHIATPEEFATLALEIETFSGLPVLGGIPALPGARQSLAEETDVEDAINALAQGILEMADLPAIAALAARTDCNQASPQIGLPQRVFRVAFAQDEAFGRYFPDNLETLEGLGAELVEFSPLADGTLPEGTDLVLLGCGYTERHAQALAANESMRAELAAFVCQGKRIYAEGGGFAYLCQDWIVDGRSIPGAGILPFSARLIDEVARPTPVERILRQSSWLGPAGTKVRGYISGRWRLERPTQTGLFACPTVTGSLTAEGDISYRHHAIGGLVHLHLAALPTVVQAFADPHQPSLLYAGRS